MISGVATLDASPPGCLQVIAGLRTQLEAANMELGQSRQTSVMLKAAESQRDNLAVRPQIPKSEMFDPSQSCHPGNFLSPSPLPSLPSLPLEFLSSLWSLRHLAVRHAVCT